VEGKAAIVRRLALLALASSLIGGRCADASRLDSPDKGATHPKAPLRAPADTLRPPPELDHGWIVDWRPPIAFFDGNRNGIADVVDIRSGASDDSDHNGVADDVDSTSTLGSVYAGEWRSWASRADTVFLFVRYELPQQVRIQYTVPLRARHIHIAVKDTTEQLVAVLRDTVAAQGSYELV
jgi:hypothetical protein